MPARLFAMKGRNPELIKLRNNKIVERYFYHSEIMRIRFDDVIRILQYQEFFLDERTLLKILRDNSDRINEMKDQQRQKMERKQLKIQFNEEVSPNLQWGKGRSSLQR
jgi:hypothetical protein